MVICAAAVGSAAAEPDGMAVRTDPHEPVAIHPTQSMVAIIPAAAGDAQSSGGIGKDWGAMP